MAFYWTLTHDLSTEEVVVIRPPTPSGPPQPPTTANSDPGTSPSKHPLQNCSIEKKDPQDNLGIFEIEYTSPPTIAAPDPPPPSKSPQKAQEAPPGFLGSFTHERN